MSRIKILTMLFITFLVATGASVALYQNWVHSYQEEVLGPQMKRQLNVVNSAIELFAFSKTNKASRHVNDASKLLQAFEDKDPKKRRNRVHDELNVLHRVKEGIKTAAVVAAVDMKGKAFVRADNPNWEADWSKVKPVQMALKGSSSHGFVMLEKKPHIVLAVPVVKQALILPEKAEKDDDDEDDEKKGKAAPKRRKCPEGRRYACWRPCVKRNKTRKCLRYAKKKRCGCIRIRRRKKTGMVAPLVVRSRRAQGAPDDKATPKPKKKAVKGSKQLGVIVLAYLLDDRLALALRRSAGMDLAFVSGKGTLLGSTLQGRLRDGFLKALKKDSSKTKAKAASSSIHLMSLSSMHPHASIRSKIKRIPSTEIVVLRPLGGIYNLFQSYVMWIGTLGGLSFLLSLVLLFPIISRFRRDLEAIEDGVLETYNTGNLRVQFNPKSADLLGPLAVSLNKLYAQLRGEPDEEDDELKRSGDWDLEGLGVDERIVSGTFPVPTEVYEEPAAQEEPAPAKEEAPQPEEEPATNPQDWIESLLSNPDAHYADVFVRYVSAKKELGEDTSKLNEERFIQKLHKNAEACMTQYEDCRGVLFDIAVKDNKVILKPQLIPKE
ncbi:MAG: hypothetical protein EP343_29725 [Deltaproteobacteria bacterium]|nr:MAG: hypothetical protein EP343_29725 [Deltaproteobacteria bacterium]